MVAKALSRCPAGHVLVIDGRGERNTALWGIMTTLAARQRGVAGVVIDGAVRDSAGIREEAFPVFARAIVPSAGGAQYLGEMNIPIQCGGVPVNPGDWVCGDEDGVVVVPALGEPFNPAVHEAILEEEGGNLSPGSVVREFRKGYLLQGRILRPARVSIAKDKKP
jgi:regulator of RNase E activity RraA